MTLNQVIRAGLEPLGLPVVPDVDTQHRPRCFTFHYDLLPVQFRDNGPAWYQALVQIHLFLPLGENSLALVERTAHALVLAGLTWPEVVDGTDESGQHKIFECEALVPLQEKG